MKSFFVLPPSLEISLVCMSTGAISFVTTSLSTAMLARSNRRAMTARRSALWNSAVDLMSPTVRP